MPSFLDTKPPNHPVPSSKKTKTLQLQVTKTSQRPQNPPCSPARKRLAMGHARPSQLFQSPTTLTKTARGQVAKRRPKTPPDVEKNHQKKSSEHPQTRRLSSLELGYLRKCSYGYYRDFIPTYGGLQIYNHGYPFVTSGAPPNRKQRVTLMGKVEMFLEKCNVFFAGKQK